MIGPIALALLLHGPQEISLTMAIKRPSAAEFVAPPGTWIQHPMTLKSLKGKVVLVDFWAYTCVNCIRTFPYIKEWYKRYHDKGFEIVAIHRPEFEFEGQPANVKNAVKRFGFTFPVLNDPVGANWDRYGVTAWPTKILLDGTGQPVARHEGEGSYGEMETQIQLQLAKLHPGMKFPKIMEPVRPTDAVGARCQPMSLEVYAAGTVLRKQNGGVRDQKKTFQYPAARHGGLFFSGSWTPKRSFVLSNGGSALMSYMAKDVDAVLRPSAGPILVEVYQDGKPADPKDLGDDVKIVNGVPTMKVQEPRMYSIIKNQKWGIREVELRPKSPGLQLYTFTFGTECRPIARKK